MKTARGVVLLALLVSNCSGAADRSLIAQFFAASRLRDLTALSKISTVVFEPAADGIVTSFEVTGVTGATASKQVSISAPVRLSDGRAVLKNYTITIRRGMITAFSESAASPSLPRP